MIRYTIQFIEFTYTNDRFSEECIHHKINKYASLLQEIKTKGWNVSPLIVIRAGVRGSTHIPSLNILKNAFQINKTSLHDTFTNINTISIQYLTSIILHKNRKENHQPLPQPSQKHKHIHIPYPQFNQTKSKPPFIDIENTCHR